VQLDEFDAYELLHGVDQDPRAGSDREFSDDAEDFSYSEDSPFAAVSQKTNVPKLGFVYNRLVSRRLETELRRSVSGSQTIGDRAKDRASKSGTKSAAPLFSVEIDVNPLDKKYDIGLQVQLQEVRIQISSCTRLISSFSCKYCSHRQRVGSTLSQRSQHGQKRLITGWKCK
jgi:hypothetical protein